MNNSGITITDILKLELDSTYKENVIDYIYALKSTRKTQGKILEKLGFRVEYRDDGSIVTYY